MIFTLIGIKVFITLVCAALFWWGGHNFLPARRFIMPSVLVVTTCILCHSFWPLMMFSSIAFLCLGYSEKSIYYKVFGPKIDRGLWGLCVGLALSLVLLIKGFLAWYFFIPYLILSFCLENYLQNVNDSWGDPLIGAGFASIIFLI